MTDLASGSEIIVLPGDGAPAIADIAGPDTARTSALTVHQLMDRPPTLQHGIGVIAPFDFALDRELWRWTPDHVSVHVTRTPYVAGDVTLDLARSISDHTMLHNAAQDLSIVQPEAVAYACTSGSFVGGLAGEKKVREAMALTGLDRSVTASGAMLAAAAALEVNNLAIVAPYVSEITVELCNFVEEAGLKAVNMNTMELGSGIWKISYADVVKLVLETNVAEAEAIFISCTNVPTFDVINPLERELGKPVISANQVLMWAALRAANLHPSNGLDRQSLISRTEPEFADSVGERF